jgi:hypothetical protein
MYSFDCLYVYKVNVYLVVFTESLNLEVLNVDSDSPRFSASKGMEIISNKSKLKALEQVGEK